MAKDAEISVLTGPTLARGKLPGGARQIGGEDVNPDDCEEAMRLLAEDGARRWPHESSDVQFSNSFQDPRNAELARRAHQRPLPSTTYPFPNDMTMVPFSARYAKSDPTPNADTAYAELLAKAQELRKADPKLTEAQAFERIYTDRANVELAKRERIESAPR